VPPCPTLQKHSSEQRLAEPTKEEEEEEEEEEEARLVTTSLSVKFRCDEWA
jgi:hypothetical protein